jgi:hypothetical protein
VSSALGWPPEKRLIEIASRKAPLNLRKDG